MPEHSTVRERVEYGLSTLPAERTVAVSLRDLMFVHQTLAEFVQFFHQPAHYPDLESVEVFLGTRGSDGAIDVLFESVYERMRKLLPQDVHDAFDEGVRFEHPKPPEYYTTEGDNPA